MVDVDSHPAEVTARNTTGAVRIFVAVLVVAGAASLVVTGGISWHGGLGDRRILVLSMIALALMSLSPVVFEWKGQSGSVNLEEVFFAMLLLTSPPAAVIVAMIFAGVFTGLYNRRSPQQLTFNLALLGLSVSSALGVTWLVAGGVPADPSWRGIAGAFAGTVTLYAVSAVGVRAIVAVAGGLPLRGLFAAMSATDLVLISASTSLGVLTGLAAAAQPLSAAFVLAPLAVMALVLRQHAHAVLDRHQLDHLLATAVAASQASSSPGVRSVLVDAAGTLLHTSDVRIQLDPPVEEELGSLIQSDESALWLVARPRTGHKGDTVEEQSMLDGIAAIGSGALGSAELLDRVRHQAFHDNLTGLPNRLLFEDRVNQALKGGERHKVGVLIVNLDLFKRVNDSLGHRAADGLLQQVADRLQATLRSSDSAARVGGDEFAVLLAVVADDGTALEVARSVNEAMRRPFLQGQQEVIVTVSVGVALSPEDGSDYESLLRAADLAMHDAKAAGRNAVRRPPSTMSSGGGMAFETELRHALEHDELWVAYQPQIDLASRRIVGTEALVRWAHPSRGQMRPDEFLPLAEELGLLGAIDEWVLAAACRQTATWRTEVPDLRVSVNVSDGPLRSGTLHELVLTTLKGTGLPATALEIEVTERVAATESAAGLESLVRLRALGVRVAIDDFGTGYSSLSRLQTLPADIVKIDQSFVREIVDGSSVVPLVTSTISMAHGLALQVVAEGIETVHQLAFLTERGCETGQGYLFGRPVPADKLRPGRSQWWPPAESFPVVTPS